MQNSVGTKVIALQNHFGKKTLSRQNVAGLVQEILSSRQPVILDFTGVSSMSFTFAKEFFGELVGELGYSAFERRVSLRGMNFKVKPLAKLILEENRTRFSPKRAA